MPPKEQPGVCMLHPYMEKRLKSIEDKLDIAVTYIIEEKALNKKESKKNENFLKLKYIFYGAVVTGIISFLALVFMKLIEFYTFL